jgi:hypothetical protein
MFGVNEFVAGDFRWSHKAFLRRDVQDPAKLPGLLFVNLGDETAEVVFCVYLSPFDKLLVALELTARLKSKDFDSDNILSVPIMCSLALFLVIPEELNS